MWCRILASQAIRGTNRTMLYKYCLAQGSIQESTQPCWMALMSPFWPPASLPSSPGKLPVIPRTLTFPAKSASQELLSYLTLSTKLWASEECVCFFYCGFQSEVWNQRLFSKHKTKWSDIMLSAQQLYLVMVLSRNQVRSSQHWTGNGKGGCSTNFNVYCTYHLLYTTPKTSAWGSWSCFKLYMVISCFYIKHVWTLIIILLKLAWI
jgi:hypothetical protein